LFRASERVGGNDGVRLPAPSPRRSRQPIVRDSSSRGAHEFVSLRRGSRTTWYAFSGYEEESNHCLVKIWHETSKSQVSASAWGEEKTEKKQRTGHAGTGQIDAGGLAWLGVVWIASHDRLTGASTSPCYARADPPGPPPHDTAPPLYSRRFCPCERTGRDGTGPSRRGFAHAFFTWLLLHFHCRASALPS
jgi:hypothetical protein